MAVKRNDWICCAFSEKDPAEAWHNLRTKCVCEYGSTCNGHDLYTWCHGDRTLVKCKKCGNLLLIQYSEYNDFIKDEDDIYIDVYPVKSANEAEELNFKYNGYTIESQFDRQALFVTNGEANWRLSPKRKI